MQHKTIIKILGIALIIISILLLLPNLVTLLDSEYREILIEEGYNLDFPFKILALSKIIISIIMLIGAVGLIKLKEGGRQITIVALILFLVIYSITSWFELKSRVEYIPLPPLIFILGLPIYYLSRKKTLKLFNVDKKQ